MTYAALFLFFYFLFCVGLMFDFFGGLLPRLFPLGLSVVDGIFPPTFSNGLPGRTVVLAIALLLYNILLKLYTTCNDIQYIFGIIFNLFV